MLNQFKCYLFIHSKSLTLVFLRQNLLNPFFFFLLFVGCQVWHCQFVYIILFCTLFWTSTTPLWAKLTLLGYFFSVFMWTEVKRSQIYKATRLTYKHVSNALPDLLTHIRSPSLSVNIYGLFTSKPLNSHTASSDLLCPLRQPPAPSPHSQRQTPPFS